MKSKNFYIPQGNGVVNGVFLTYNEVGVVVTNNEGKIEFNKVNSKFSFITKIKNIFLLRGLFLFFINLFAYIRSFDISFMVHHKSFLSKGFLERKLERKKFSRFWFLFSFFAILFFVVLPVLFYFLCNRLKFYGFAFEFVRVAIKFVSVILFLLVLRKLEISKDIFKHNFAISKVINSFSKQEGIEYEEIKKSGQFCVLNFSTNFFATFFLLFVLVPLVWFDASLFVNIVAKILASILIICLAYEVELVVECYYKESVFVRLIGFVFILFSKLMSVKCGQKQEEVAAIVMEEVIQMNFDKVNDLESGGKGVSFSVVLANVKRQLVENGIDEYEARILVCETLGISAADLVLVRTVSKTQANKIEKVLGERIKHKPLCKILGYKHFYGLKFYVNENVLSPRQETEVLVEEVLGAFSDKKLDVLDMCTGSGAIAISIKKNANCNVTAVDKSKRALAVAKKNANTHKCEINFICSDMFKHLKDENKFDIIVSNPPYIATKEIETLDEEVKNHDPKMSLDGGNDGLKFYKILAKEGHRFLKKGGKIFVEIGFDQAQSVSDIFSKNFVSVEVVQDFLGLPRVVKAVKG